MKRTMLILIGLSACALSAQAGVILDDDFIGSDGDPVNPTLWDASGTVALDGGGNVALIPSSSSALTAKSAYGYHPTGSDNAKLSLQGNVVAWCTIEGLSGAGDNHILLHTDWASNWVVDIMGGTGTGASYMTSVPRDYTSTKNWVIEWFPANVRVYLEGSLILDTSATTPTGGAASWSIPTVDLAPMLHTYSDGNPLRMGRVTWETVPEPATMSLLVVGGLSLLRRKR